MSRPRVLHRVVHRWTGTQSARDFTRFDDAQQWRDKYARDNRLEPWDFRIISFLETDAAALGDLAPEPL